MCIHTVITSPFVYTEYVKVMGVHQVRIRIQACFSLFHFLKSSNGFVANVLKSVLLVVMFTWSAELNMLTDSC